MRIELPTQEEQDQARRFRTYVNYLSSIRSHLKSEYSDPTHLVARIVGSGPWSKIHRRSDIDRAALQTLLRNAWFTEIQIQVAAPTDDLIPYSNHWAPVQLYYSLYLLARAWLLASGHQINDSHTPVLRAVAAEIRSRPGLFPVPWRLLVGGDPAKGSQEYLNLPAGVTIGPVSSLEDSPNFWDSFAMFLRTTRDRQVERSIGQWKKREHRKKIPAAARHNLASALPPTSLFDALYRLRIRSNYADADTFLLSVGNTAEAKQFHLGLRSVGWYSMLVLETLIAASAGKSHLASWVESFDTYDIADYSKRTVRRRWEYIEAVL